MSNIRVQGEFPVGGGLRDCAAKQDIGSLAFLSKLKGQISMFNFSLITLLLCVSVIIETMSAGLHRLSPISLGAVKPFQIRF